MSQVQAADTLREWRESAKYWQKHSATIRSMFAPLTRALIEDAGISPGQSVLDVAGGPGEPSDRSVSRYVEMPPVDLESPGAFRFAEPGKLAGILREAGGNDISERIWKFNIEAAISVEEFWTMRSETSEILREKLKSLTEEQTLRVAEKVQEKVREFFPNNEMSFPAQMMIVTGKKRYA